MFSWYPLRKTLCLLVVLAGSSALHASGSLSLPPSTEIADTTAPSVEFLGLNHYSRPHTNVPLSVRASDDVGVSRVELYVDRVLHATNTVAPNSTHVLVSFDWATVPGGKHMLEAKAIDSAGNARSAFMAVVPRRLTPPTGHAISVIPSITYQTMQGWEVTSEAGQWVSPAWNNYKNLLFDRAVNDLGLNRIRLEIKSGAENPTDYFAQWRAGQITESQYNAKRYEIINDDADPNHINPNGFKWSQLDSAIEQLVIPMRQRLQARGESLWVNLNYVDFGSSSFEHKTSPAEYAEFVLATYQHMHSRYGFVPDSWEVILEPDTNASWSSTQVAQAIKAAGDKLVANGFTPSFTAPSTTNASNALPFIDQIAATPDAMKYVGEFSYHRYSGVSTSVLTNIANRAILYGKNAAMLEKIGTDHSHLHQDIKLGRNSSWQQYCLAGPTSWGPDSGDRLFIVDDANPSNPTLTMGSRTKMLRQYFRFIRSGAQRVEALSGHANYDPLAFINPNGKYVVVVKTVGNGSFTLQGLPGGTYGIKYSTAAQYDVDLPDATLSHGQALSATIPAAGVITIYGR